MSLAVWLVVALAASASAAPSNLALASPSGRIDPQIVGGEVVDIKKVPYQVSIERNNGHICGGSVLSNSWILTAGHCLKGIPVSQLRVRVGSSTLQMGGSVHAVGAGYAHPHYVMYGQTYADFDVALLQLSTPVSLSDSVKTVKLPPSGKEPSTNTVVVASGWGLYSAQPGKRVLQGMSRPALQRDGLDGVEDEDVEQHHPVDAPALSKQLRRVTVRTILRKQCSDSYLKVKAYFTERMICAAAPAKDTCTYDSGGPLVDASGVQVGIVSWGRGCADARFPGVYTNIGNADIRAFIKTYTRL